MKKSQTSDGALAVSFDHTCSYIISEPHTIECFWEMPFDTFAQVEQWLKDPANGAEVVYHWLPANNQPFEHYYGTPFLYEHWVVRVENWC